MLTPSWVRHVFTCSVYRGGPQPVPEVQGPQWKSLSSAHWRDGLQGPELAASLLVSCPFAGDSE